LRRAGGQLSEVEIAALELQPPIFDCRQVEQAVDQIVREIAGRLDSRASSRSSALAPSSMSSA
jgi:hypothetical protein